MSQIKTGIKKILENPKIYENFQRLLGASRSRKYIVENYYFLNSGHKVLDVGCGPGTILDFIQIDVDYYGFDFQQSYIDKAKSKFGHRAKFQCADVLNFDFGDQKFDLIIINGVLHHLENSEVEILFKKLATLLSDTGRLVCVENVFIEKQNPVAKFLISQDRGQNVRKVEEYLSLFSPHFPKAKYTIHHDLLKIPYTHIVIDAKL